MADVVVNDVADAVSEHDANEQVGIEAHGKQHDEKVQSGVQSGGGTAEKLTSETGTFPPSGKCQKSIAYYLVERGKEQLAKRNNNKNVYIFFQ